MILISTYAEIRWMLRRATESGGMRTVQGLRTERLGTVGSLDPEKRPHAMRWESISVWFGISRRQTLETGENDYAEKTKNGKRVDWCVALVLCFHGF